MSAIVSLEEAVKFAHANIEEGFSIQIRIDRDGVFVELLDEHGNYLEFGDYKKDAAELIIEATMVSRNWEDGE